MNREEAASVLREIALNCGPIGEEAIILMPPHSNDVLSQGYQLHIKPGVSLESLNCVEKIAKEHNLSVKHEVTNNLTIIYRDANRK